MPRNFVEALYGENQSISRYLEEQGEVSYLNSVENSFRKVLLLAIASYFESTLVAAFLTYIKLEFDESHPLYKIIKAKAIDRQYHTWFAWEDRNANKFFGMFGKDFRTFMTRKIEEDPAIGKGVESFLEIGNLRNLLVHRNFAEFTVEKTPQEIYDLYKDAMAFVYGFLGCLTEFSGELKAQARQR